MNPSNYGSFSVLKTSILESLHTREEKYKYIYMLYLENNRNASKTGRELSIDTKRIKRARDYCEAQEINPAFVLQHEGRPIKLTDPIKQHIIVETYLHPEYVAADLIVSIFQTFQIKISDTTINRFRRKEKYFYGPKLTSFILTQDAISKRLQFAHTHIAQDTDWTRVVFTDESYFELGRNNHYVWRRHGDYRPCVCSSKNPHPKKVMVWGAVGHGFKSDLVFINGTLTAETFIDNVLAGSTFIDSADRTFGAGCWVMQEDNAPCHNARLTQEVLQDFGVNVLKNWPPHSPDLNIIEIVWALMKTKVENKRPKTLDELIQIVQEVWGNLNPSTITALINSVAPRLRQLISNNGQQVRSYSH